MSDERLRELERRFREEPTPEHGAEWIRAKLRLGLLTTSDVRTAAQLGHAGARKALDLRQKATKRLDKQFNVLAQHGARAFLRAVLILLESITEKNRYRDSDIPTALRALARYLVTPTEETREEALTALAAVKPRPPRSKHRRLFEAIETTHSWVAERHPIEASRYHVFLWTLGAPSELRQRVTAELIPWLLGEEDPLAERI